MTHISGPDELRAYLSTRVEDEAQRELHMLLMDPFFVHAHNQHYRLAEADGRGVRDSELTHAISLATEREIVTSATASIGLPGTFAIFLNNAWKKRLRRLTGNLPMRFIHEANRAWHGRDGIGAFLHVFETAVWNGSLEEAFDFPSRVLNDHAKAIVRGILLAYLSHAANGSVVGTKRLAPLVSVLPTAIPLGETEEWPGTCLFLVE